MRRVVVIVLLWVGVAWAGCGGESKHVLLERSADVRTKAELENALGAPDERHKLGPVETWTYEAENGTVSFLITGNRVRLQSTGPASDDE